MDLPFWLALFVVGVLGVANAGPVYDFEVPGQEYAFRAEESARANSSLYHKSGSQSLLWHWATRNQQGSPAKLTIQLGESLKIENKELQSGGLKFWMYRESATPATTMEIVFRGKAGSSTTFTTTPTMTTLNFQGWRSVWIGYEEFGSEMANCTVITNVDFKITTLLADKLYLDVVRFVPSLRKQSRDIIVRKVGTSARSSDPLFHDDKDFWQQSLRWYEAVASRSTTPVTNVDAKINEIQSIENRLENWYAKVGETLKTLTKFDDFAIDMAMDPDGGIDFQVLKQKRWKSLQTDIEAANAYYNKIDFQNNRPPLFAKVEELGEDDITDDPNFKSKFGFFFARILLPLSLEYNFMSREAEVNALASKVCTSLKSTDYLTMLRAITEITGSNDVLVGLFENILKANKNKLNCASTKTSEQVSAADLINLYNEMVRWERIKGLLIYIEKQGWAEGSGLGSLDHEMNKAGSGFMHSMFLLRHTLRKTENVQLLNRLINAMKWYNDFNEIYQAESDYVYDGTTADRMRTICLYRLITILITPSNTNKESKIRDIEHFLIWFKHALTINKGLGGVIKPDYTSFHHKTFYGSAYVPHALHNAALVQYLLEGTTFKLDEPSKTNLREALSVLRMTAVKYSSPNSIGGRFPGYNNAILAEQFAAYAYISYEKEGATEKAKGRDMFLRLFNHNEPSVKAYLEDGTIKSGIYYWNTIGQLDVLQKISTLTCTSKCTAETSPTGHWSKNFASLSIHRRNNWTIAAKGFNRYTWDYESSPKENVFGVFASHGSLQISNSESSLKSYDVSDGWDWTRVPGATTIRAELVNIVLGKARNYNAGHFAGGVSFTGSIGSQPRNGAFGMVFKKPGYVMKNKASPMGSMEFEFKKSYFFYNDLVVCLGSDIKFQNKDIENYYAQTTLFQDKLVDPARATTITVDSKAHDLRLLLKRQYKWTTGQTIRLVDTNGNTYQVKNAKSQGLNVEIVDKEKARYATAWYEHKKRQNTSCTTTITSLNKKAPSKLKKARKTTKKSKSKKIKKKGKGKRLKKDKAIINQIPINKKRKIKQNSKTSKKRIDDDIYVNGMNINADENVKSQMEIEDDPETLPNKKASSKIKKARNDTKKSRKTKTNDKGKRPKNHKTIVQIPTNKKYRVKPNSKTTKKKMDEGIHVNGVNLKADENAKSEMEIAEYAQTLPNKKASRKIKKARNNIKKSRKTKTNDKEKPPKKHKTIIQIQTNKKRKLMQNNKTSKKKLDENIDMYVNGVNLNADQNAKSEMEIPDYAQTLPNKKASSKIKKAINNIKKSRKTKTNDKEKLPQKHKTIIQIQTNKKRKLIQNNKTSKKKIDENIDMYVNGVNLNVDHNATSEMEIADDAEDSTMSMSGRNEKNEVKSIDDNNAGIQNNVDEHSDNDVSDDHDDRGYYDDEEMDGLGNDIDYDDGSNSDAKKNDKNVPHTNDNTPKHMNKSPYKTNNAVDVKITLNRESIKDEQGNSKENERNADEDTYLNILSAKEDTNMAQSAETLNNTNDEEMNVEQQNTQVTATGNGEHSGEPMELEDKDISKVPNLTTNESNEYISKPQTFENSTMYIKVDETKINHDTENRKNEEPDQYEDNNKTTKEGEEIQQRVTKNNKHDHIEINTKSNSKNYFESIPNQTKANAKEVSKHKLDSWKDLKDFESIPKQNEVNEANNLKSETPNTKEDPSNTVEDGNNETDKANDQTTINKNVNKKIKGETEFNNKINYSIKAKSSKGKKTKENEHFDQMRLKETNKDESNQDKEKQAEVQKKMNLKLKERKVRYNKLNKVMDIAIEKAKHTKARETINETEATRDDQMASDKWKFYYNSSLTIEDTDDSHTTKGNAYLADADKKYSVAADTSSYEYAIIVQGGDLTLLSKYTVIGAGGKFHAVEFSGLPDLSSMATNVYAYSIFEPLQATESIPSGPVIKTSAPCMVMAELATTTLHLAVSNPAITFQDDPTVKDKDKCTRQGRKDINDKFSPKNSDEVGSKMMFCVEGAKTSVTLSLRLDNKPNSKLASAVGVVKVDGRKVKLTNREHYVTVDSTKNEVTFLNLENGFTTEVLLSYIQA